MEFSLADVETLLNVAQKVDANPVSLAGRLVGFSGPEQRAGIPPWAIAIVAVAGTAAAVYYLGPRVQEVYDNSQGWLSKGGKKPNKSRKVFGRWG
jgi:hypothetical protein